MAPCRLHVRRNGVETFPARPQYLPQAMEGGTCPGRESRPDQPQPMMAEDSSSCVEETEERLETVSPRPGSSSFGRRYPPWRRPDVIDLRRVSWTGWERLYVLR